MSEDKESSKKKKGLKVVAETAATTATIVMSGKTIATVIDSGVSAVKNLAGSDGNGVAEPQPIQPPTSSVVEESTKVSAASPFVPQEGTEDERLPQVKVVQELDESQIPSVEPSPIPQEEQRETADGWQTEEWMNPEDAQPPTVEIISTQPLMEEVAEVDIIQQGEMLLDNDVSEASLEVAQEAIEPEDVLGQNVQEEDAYHELASTASPEEQAAGDIDAVSMETDMDYDPIAAEMSAEMTDNGMEEIFREDVPGFDNVDMITEC